MIEVKYVRTSNEYDVAKLYETKAVISVLSTLCADEIIYTVFYKEYKYAT